jgi:hypothetical protein
MPHLQPLWPTDESRHSPAFDCRKAIALATFVLVADGSPGSGTKLEPQVAGLVEDSAQCEEESGLRAPPKFGDLVR